MSGLLGGLTANLLSAKTAMVAVDAQNRSLSALQCREQTLKAEIKSGNGDVEGKQAELQQVQEQTEKANSMLQSSMNRANQSIGSTNIAGTDKEDKTNKSDKTNKAEEKKDNEVATEESKNEAKKVDSKLEGSNVTAVDYEKGMQIAQEGKTNIAVSPDFLEHMAADKDTEAAYINNFETMQSIDRKYADASDSSVWAVDKNGSVRHYTQVANATEAAEKETSLQQIREAGRAAFGDAFAGAYITIVSQARPTTTTTPAASGLLIDTSL